MRSKWREIIPHRQIRQVTNLLSRVKAALPQLRSCARTTARRKIPHKAQTAFSSQISAGRSIIGKTFVSCNHRAGRIRHNVTNILQKLNVRNRTQAALKF
jgi:hypothetical protein